MRNEGRSRRLARSARRAVGSAAAVVAWLVAVAPAGGGDWPQWMGPHRSGAVAAPGTFADDRPVRLAVEWRRPLAGGYSSVTVAGGRAYTLGSGQEEDALVAFDAGRGAELWRHRLDAAGAERTLSTPAVGGGRVFAVNGRGMLHAVAAADGTPLWWHDLRDEMGASPPSYGMSTSPLLVDGRVLVLVGGREGHNLVAFDQVSGDVDWSVFHARRGSYASPTLVEIGGQRQVVVPADDLLYAVRPEDGELLWSHAGLGYFDRVPLLLAGGRLFLAQESSAVMLRIARAGDRWTIEELWKTRELKDSYSPAVHHRGSIFGFNGSFLTALDADTGERRWNRQMSTGSLILVDRHLLVLDAMTGVLTVVAARPDEYVERAKLQVVTITEGASSFASPSYAGGRIFVRGGEEIAAIQIGR